MIFLLDKRYQPYIAVTACFVVHVSLGASYSVVNLVPYIASYLRYVKQEDRSVGQMVWFDALNTGAQGASMFVGGLLEKRLGTRNTVLIGCIVSVLGAGSTFFAVHLGAGFAYVTYGIIFGIGKGIAYAPCIATSMRWFPRIKGLIAGVTASGFGLGFLISTLATTLFVNPSKMAPRYQPDGSVEYDDLHLLHRVPRAFLILAGICGALQVLALPFISNPRTEELPDIITTAATLEVHRVSKPSKTENLGMLPLDMTKTQTFYNLWFTFFFNAAAVNFLITYYHEYGLEVLDSHENHFLEVTSAVASALSLFGPIFWGRMTDRRSYQVTACLISSIIAFLLFTLAGCRNGGKPMFFIWTVLIYFTVSGNYALFPQVTSRVYGPANFTANYGIVFTSCSVACIITAVISSLWLRYRLFTEFFFVFAIGECISFVLSATVHLTDLGRPQGVSEYGAI